MSSRHFDDALTTYLQVDAAPVNQNPFTFSAWVWLNDLAGSPNRAFIWIGDSGAPFHYATLYFNNADNSLRCAIVNAGPAFEEDVGGTLSATTWHHVMGTHDGTTILTYLDGTASSGTASTRTFTSANRFSIGVARDSTPTAPMDGRIARVAIWNKVLGQDAATELAAGAPADGIERKNLVAYPKLMGNKDPEPCYVSGQFSLDVVGNATKDLGPPVSRRRRHWNDMVEELSPPAAGVTRTLLTLGAGH